MANSGSTQTTLSKLSEDHHRWARAYLRSASPDPATVARLLKQSDFKSVAWNTLAIRAALSPEKRTFSAVDQAMLAEAADSWAVNTLSQFATDFFQIEVSERHAIHETFVRQNASNPSILAYLKHLEQGLSLDPSRYVFNNPDERKLADYALTVFVQWPLAAARMRREFAPRLTDRFHWAQVAARLKKSAPKIAALIPEMLPVRRSFGSRVGLSREGRFPKRKIGQSTQPAKENSSSPFVWVIPVFVIVGQLFIQLGKREESKLRYQPPPKLPSRLIYNPSQIPANPTPLEKAGLRTMQILMGVDEQGNPLPEKVPVRAFTPQFINADEVLRDPAEKAAQPEQAPANKTDSTQPEKMPE